jgi:lathosterol oxidase
LTGFALTYLGLLLIIQLRYVAVAGLFHGILWGRPEEKVRAFRLARQRPTRQAVWREARTSLLVSFIYALPAAILIEAWKAGGTAIYEGSPQTALGWAWLPLSVFVYLFLHDTYFYWSHRAMPLPRFYAATHRTHHISKQPTPWASFAFSPWEALISAWFVPALAFVIPIHIGAFLALLTIATVFAVCNHAGWEVWPKAFLDGPVGRQLMTARLLLLIPSDHPIENDAGLGELKRQQSAAAAANSAPSLSAPGRSFWSAAGSGSSRSRSRPRSPRPGASGSPS